MRDGNKSLVSLMKYSLRVFSLPMRDGNVVSFPLIGHS